MILQSNAPSQISLSPKHARSAYASTLARVWRVGRETESIYECAEGVGDKSQEPRDKGQALQV